MTASVEAARGAGFGLAPTLLRARGRMVVNGAFRAGRERRAWVVMGAVAAGGFVLASYRGAAGSLDAADLGPDRAAPILAGALGMLALFTLITSITFALGSMYMARDLDLLVSAPLPGRTVLLTRLCTQLATGAALGAVLAGPPLAAYLARHGGVLLLPLAGLTVVSMAAMPLCLGTAVTVVVARLLPARRVREAGGVLVVAVVFGVAAGNLALRGPESFTHAPSALDPAQRGGLAASLWLPTGWAARSLAGMTRGDGAAVAGYGVPLVIAAAATLVVTSWLLERAWATGLSRSWEAGRGRRRPPRAASSPASASRATRPAWVAIVLKDVRETLRDPSLLAQLLLPVLLFALTIASPSSGAGLERAAWLPSWFGTTLVGGFAGLFAASGIALRGVGAEGRRLALLRTAPVRVRSVLAAKLTTGAAVALALAELILVIGMLRGRVALVDMPMLAAQLAIAVGGLCALATGMGSVRPRLDWTDPRRSVGVGTSLGFLALGSAYLTVVFVVLSLPYAVTAHPSWTARAAGTGVLGALAAAVGGAALLAGAARLRTLEL